MNINNVTRHMRSYALPLAMVFMVSNTVLRADTGNASQIITEQIDKASFIKADKNNDGVLNFDEFVSMGKKANIQSSKLISKPIEQKMNIGVGLLALGLALIDIVGTAINKKKNP